MIFSEFDRNSFYRVKIRDEYFEKLKNNSANIPFFPIEDTSDDHENHKEYDLTLSIKILGVVIKSI